MPHLSHLLAATCAITVILVSLPSDAGIGDKDLPLLNGEKTKLLYTVAGVRHGLNLATVFHCTSTERTGGNDIHVGIEVFNSLGILRNDVTIGNGTLPIGPGETSSFATGPTNAFVNDELLQTNLVDQGSARIFATGKNILCSAMIVDPDNYPPTSMVMLPVFRTNKQKGM